MDKSTAAQLLTIVQRVEAVHEEKKSLGDDVRDIYLEAKGNGFDVKIVREIVRLRARDPGELAEAAQLLEVYLGAIATAEGRAPGPRATQPHQSAHPEPALAAA